ncbi:MAG: DEAD/DEAH box helicase [Nitrososphaerota archaeon]
MGLSEPLISCYQDLILAEYDKIKTVEFILQDPNSRLTSTEVNNVLSKYMVNINQLLSEGLLVCYPDGSYRTIHMDLVYRAVNLRTADWSPKIPLEFKLCEPRQEYVPSFKELDLRVLRDTLSLPDSLIDPIIEALRNSEYKGLAYHQYHYIKKILGNKDRCYLLVSPTASGKSLIFYLVIIATILRNIKSKGTKAIILYPRKALASDQLLKFLKILSFLNVGLAEKGIRQVSIGIDDGDTPRSPASDMVRKRKSFRGIKCLMKNCGGMLRYEPKENYSEVVCDKCGKFYKEIIPTKDEIWSLRPDIIFSNLTVLNRRMMTTLSQGIIGAELEWIVLDEAHAYREELGGHVRWLLNRLMARFGTLVKGQVRFIVSSATIYNPIGFVSKLLGLSSDIYYEPFEDVLKLSKEKLRKLTIDLIIAPNPLRSAETLAEELALLLSVWGYTNNKKGILFVDNVSEVERLYTFVVDTIIKERQEHNDHIDPSIVPTVGNIGNPFSWLSITRTSTYIDPARLAAIISYHYGELETEERARIEEEFKTKSSGFLFSTSTLELGMDISDIAAIVQYKVPITSESYVQRVSRAGRSDNVLRVALGILVVTNSPSQVRYVIGNEYLRLVRPQVEIPVAWENEEIKKQHLIFSMLDVLASRGHSTYLDYKTEVEPSWSSVEEVLQSLEDIITEIKKNMNLVLNYLNSLFSDPTKTFNDIVSLIEKNIQIARTQVPLLSSQDIQDRLKNLRLVEDKVVDASKRLEKNRKRVEKLILKVSVQELSDYQQRLVEVEQTLRNVLGELEKLWG